MKSRKKTPLMIPPTLFLIFAEGEYEGRAETYEEAETKAIELMEIDPKENVYILEVTRAWAVEYPEEPEPEIYSCSLDNLEI